MSLSGELSKALDNLTPLKRKILRDDTNGKRLKTNSKGDALDLESFYSRLSTYRPGNWNSFHPLSPLYAASWGWICQKGSQNIRCVSCRGTLITSLPKRSIPSVFNKAANILKKRINTSLEKGGAHEKFCPWLAANCPDIFQEVYLASQLHQPFVVLKDIFHEEWILSFTQLLSLRQIPYIPMALRPPHSSHVYKILKKTYPSISYPEQQLHFESIFVLALCGWQKKSDLVIQCKLCQRQCGLWNFPSLTDKASMERDKNDKMVEEKKLEESIVEKSQHEHQSDENVQINKEESNDVVVHTSKDSENKIDDGARSGEESVEDNGREEDDYPSPNYSDESNPSENEEEEEEEEEEDIVEEEGQSDVNSDSDTIEIISSSEDEEVLREDTEPENRSLYLEEDSAHSSEEIEVDNNSSKSSPSKSSCPNSEDELNEPPLKDSSHMESPVNASQDVPIEKTSNDEEKDSSKLLECENTDKSMENIHLDQESKEESVNQLESTTSLNDNTLSKEKSSESDIENNDSNQSVEAVESVSFFNPISQHQPWCPWVSKGLSTQRTGYETVLFVLQDKLVEEKKTSLLYSFPNVQDKMKKMLSVLESVVN